MNSNRNKGLYILLILVLGFTLGNCKKKYFLQRWRGYIFCSENGGARDVIKRFIRERAALEMVRVGNEIHNGMLWPVGRIEGDSADPFSVLLRSASAAVCVADPSISFYPEWQGTLEDRETNLTDLTNRYNKPIVVVEYKEHKREVNEIVKNLPYGVGLGTLIWEATSPRWGVPCLSRTVRLMKI